MKFLLSADSQGQYSSDLFDINDPDMAPFFEFLKSTTPWFLLFKYIFGVLPVGLDFMIPLVQNYLKKEPWIFEGTPYIPLIFIGIANYGLTLPVDIFLLFASTTLSERNVRTANNLHRVTSIVIFLW